MASSLNSDCTLLSLPSELLLKILAISIDPRAIGQFSATCRDAHSFCSTSTALWRDSFLMRWDHPGGAVDWKQLVQRRTAAKSEVELFASRQGILEDLSTLALGQLLEIARTRPPSPSESLNSSYLASLLPPSFLLPDPYSRPSTLASHLRALAAPSLVGAANATVRRRARESVYEHANCRSPSWGPMQSEGDKVDWCKVEALQIVTAANLREAIVLGWGDEPSRSAARGEDSDSDSDDAVDLPRTGWESTRPGAPPKKEAGEVADEEEETGEQQEREQDDWAGVEDGEWHGTYFFLNYEDYEHFNFHRTPGSTPSLSDEDSEAIGDCMRLKLRLLPQGEIPRPPDAGDGFEFDFAADAVRSSPSNSSDSEDEEYGAAGTSSSSARRTRSRGRPSPQANFKKPQSSKPELSFIGTSHPLLSFTGSFSNLGPRQGRDLSRSIRGTVRMTEEGEVCWRYIIRYGGGDQWLMNGVQVGGPRSQFGVVGYWSTAEHEEAGPHGPFYYAPFPSAPDSDEPFNAR